MIDVVVVNFGTKYPQGWVRRLRRAVARNLSRVHSFVCVTDRPASIPGPMACAVREDLGGWWNHLHAYEPGLFRHKVLMLDVDDVVVGPLDDIAAVDAWAMDEDVYNRGQLDGGVQVIPPGAGEELWHHFMADPEETKRRYSSDKFLYQDLSRAALLNPLVPGQIVSYKVHVRDGNDGALPEGARIVRFHGSPKPSEVDHEWVKKNWLE